VPPAARQAPTEAPPAGSVEDPAPAVWAGVLVVFQGFSDLLGGPTAEKGVFGLPTGVPERIIDLTLTRWLFICPRRGLNRRPSLFKDSRDGPIQVHSANMAICCQGRRDP
jgi:hypothetical protein